MKFRVKKDVVSAFLEPPVAFNYIIIIIQIMIEEIEKVLCHAHSN